MDIWEKKLNIKKPDTCKRTAICCQTATSVSPWNKIHNAKKNQALKDFFNIFIPYKSKEEMKKKFPDAYEACIKTAKSRKDVNIDNIYFYHCRFLREPNFCTIYEDRPDVCRNYPASPFDAISIECGYNNWSNTCKQRYIDLQLNLRKLKLEQFKNNNFYLISPCKSWLK